MNDPRPFLILSLGLFLASDLIVLAGWALVGMAPRLVAWAFLVFALFLMVRPERGP